jgi:hypothetical protein
MTLDSKQKKGSAIGLLLPFRQWLAEPVATIGDGEKLSLLKLCSDVTLSVSTVDDLFWCVAQDVFLVGAPVQDAFPIGAIEQDVFLVGSPTQDAN